MQCTTQKREVQCAVRSGVENWMEKGDILGVQDQMISFFGSIKCVFVNRFKYVMGFNGVLTSQ